MLLLRSKIDDSYSIIDTDDMVVETLSKNELLDVLNQGIFIYGVSSFSLENNIDMTIILRLYGENEVKDYDGVLLSDYFDDYNEFNTQIIDWKDNSNDLIRQDVFDLVIECIRAINKVPESLNTDLPVGYTLFSTGDKSVNLKELSSGEMYSCDFFTCLDIYLNEKLSIEGIDEITMTYMICNSNFYGASTILDSYKTSSISSDVRRMIKVSDAVFDDLEATWGSIDSVFGYNDCIKVTDCGFPLYNIKNCIKRYNCSLTDRDFATLNSVAYKFEGGVLHFRNGHYIGEAKDLARSINILNFETEELKSDVLKYLEIAITKEKALKINKGVADNMNLSASHLDDVYRLKCPPYRINDIRHRDLAVMRTKFGLIYVVQSEIVNLNESYSNMFLLRLTHTGVCWFSAQKGCIVNGTSQESWKGGDLCNDDFISACWDGIRAGISYNHDVLIPLGISSVNVEDDFIDVNVHCLILADADCTLRHSLNVVEVPLLFLGSRLDEFDDCFRLQGLFTTIFLDKEIVYNLHGTFDEDSFMNVWEKLTTKPSKLMYNSLYKHSKNVLKQVSDL